MSSFLSCPSFRFGEDEPGSSKWVIGELVGRPPVELAFFTDEEVMAGVLRKPTAVQRIWCDTTLVYDASGGAV